MTHPWTDEFLRPVSHVPEPPEKINPKYCLYTRRNGDNCQVSIKFPFSVSSIKFSIEYTDKDVYTFHSINYSFYLSTVKHKVEISNWCFQRSG